MQQFMAEITLPENPPQEFFLLIPLQRIQVGILFKSGRLINYSLSIERSKLWAIFNGNSEEEVMNIIDIFPLRRFMEVHLHQLAFYEQPLIQFPLNSLN